MSGEDEAGNLGVFSHRSREFRRVPRGMHCTIPFLRSLNNLCRDAPRQSETFRSLSAFATTETELSVIAALAIMGLRSSPNTG